MIVRTSPSVSYSMWLKRILDSHASRAWEAAAGGREPVAGEKAKKKGGQGKLFETKELPLFDRE